MLLRFSSALLLFILSTAAVGIFAQNPRGDWRSVESSDINTLLGVETKDGQITMGHLNAVSPSEATVTKLGNTASVALDRLLIKKVYSARDDI